MRITKSEFIKSGTNKTHMINNHEPEFLFCGRSNVGKSSFINSLCNRKNLARTSATPGKTQTLNLYHINDSIIFVDVPGYGYARVSKTMLKQFGEMIEEYVTTRKELKLAFVLVDIRHEPTNDDLDMYNFLKYYNIKVKIIATKYDKIKKSQLGHQLKIIKEKLNLDNVNDIYPISSVTKFGMDKVENIFDDYLNK